VASIGAAKPRKTSDRTASLSAHPNVLQVAPVA
jgi:hypothetical protein